MFGTAQKNKLQQGTPEYSSQLQAEIWGAAGALCLWLWLLQFAHKTPDFIGKLQPPALGCYFCSLMGQGSQSPAQRQREQFFFPSAQRGTTLSGTLQAALSQPEAAHTGGLSWQRV